MKSLFLICFLVSSCALFADGDKAQEMSWTFTRKLSEAPRGGSSQGTTVTYDEKTPQAWRKLKQRGLNAYQKDRRAILAMAGEYETKFEFLETFIVDSDKSLDRPYASWGTEFVKVIEDKDDFISLQHIMVMFYKDPETGEVKGPFVMKHWRQDFIWQGREFFEYQGSNTWKLKTIDSETVRGKWVWNVYQVDDSPRYSGIGSWTHFSSASTFSTDMMSRPLPRREKSVRSDYKVLLGQDTLVVTKNAWFHEQRNFKHKKNLSSKGMRNSKLLSRELGQNSYKRIKDFEFQTGYDYWTKSKNYWQDVRLVWNRILVENETFTLLKDVGGKPLFAFHFEQAEDPKVLAMSARKRQALIYKTITSFISK